jgi:TPR repeat protein
MVKSTSEYHCEQLKEKGNKHFIAKKWMEAVDFYTEALHYSAEISPNLVGILYKNRCAAYLSEAGNSENPSLGYLKKATQDAIEATKFTPYDAKAYYRLGSAYNAREKYEKAVKALERADVLSPNDPQVMSLLKECRQYAAKVERGEFQDTRFTAEPNYEDLYARFNMTAEQKEKFNTTINSAEFGKFVETLFPGKTRTNQGLKHLNKREFGLALREFTAAAAKGDAEGMFNLGYCYINGYGTKKNVSLAEYWYTKASEQPPFVRDMPNVGVAEGLHGLALILLNEPAILEKKKGFKLMEKAAELKLSLAQNSLGALYDKGEVVPRDKKKAIEFYKLAAEQGDAQAMLNLANSYAFEDTERALMWAEKAVSLGASQGLPLLLALRETKNAIEEEGEVKEEEEKVEESDLLFASRFAELLKIKTEPESTFHVNYNFSKEAMEECGSEYAQMFLSCYALKEKARKEFESGNFDAAVSLVAEMIRIPESSLIQVEQAFYEFPKFAPPSADSDLIDFRVITMTKSHNAVEAHAKLLIKKYPDEPYYYKMCGTSLSFEHRWDQAIQFFNSGLSLPLTKSNKDLECEFFYLLAIAERQNNLVDRSLRHYKQFLLLCPDSHRSVPTAHYSIANLISRKIKKSDPDGSIIDEVNFHYQKGLQAEKALPPVFRKKKMPCQVVVELLLSILRPEAIQDIRTTQAPANVTYNGDRPSSPLQQKTIGKSGSANGTNLGSSKKQETIATMEDRSNPNKQSPTTTTITATATKQKQIPKSPQLSLDQIVVAFLHTIKSNRHPLSFLIPAIAATKKWGDFKTLNGLYKPPLKKALSCSPELDFITENNAVIVILKPVMPSSESETAESSEEPPELETKEPCLELKNNFVIGDGEWQKQRGKKKSEQIQSPSTQKTQTQTAKPQQLRPQRQPKQPQSPQTHAPAKPPQPKQSQLPKTQARPSQPPAAKPQQPKQSQPPKTQAHPSQPPAAKPQQPKQTQPSKMQTRPSQPPAAKPQQPKQTQPPKTQTRPSQPKQTQPSKTQTRPSQPPAAKPQQPKQSQPPKTQTRPSQPPAAKATQISTTPKNPNPSQTTTNSIPEAARQTVSVSATTKNLKATNHTPLKF